MSDIVAAGEQEPERTGSTYSASNKRPEVAHMLLCGTSGSGKGSIGRVLLGRLQQGGAVRVFDGKSEFATEFFGTVSSGKSRVQDSVQALIEAGRTSSVRVVDGKSAGLEAGE